jgi:hypothetical protein
VSLAAVVVLARIRVPVSSYLASADNNNT